MPPVRPRALILDFFGAFARRMDGWIGVAPLVRLLADVGLDEAAVRSAVSRLKRRGWLRAERRAGSAGYALTEIAIAELERGDRRIFQSNGPALLRDGWTLVAFSVPETRRDVRHR